MGDAGTPKHASPLDAIRKGSKATQLEGVLL